MLGRSQVLLPGLALKPLPLSFLGETDVQHLRIRFLKAYSGWLHTVYDRLLPGSQCSAVRSYQRQRCLELRQTRQVGRSRQESAGSPQPDLAKGSLGRSEMDW